MHLSKMSISCNRVGAGGGMERYAQDLALFLQQKIGPITVYTKKIDRGYAHGLLVDPIPITVSWIPRKLRDYIFSWRLNKLRKKDEVLIGCNRVVNAQIAVCGGTHLGFLLACNRRRSLKDYLQILLERRHYKQAKIIIAHSKLVYREIINFYGIKPQQIKLIYPPVNTHRFTPVTLDERKALRQKYGFASNKMVLLFPSCNHKLKGFYLIARLLDKLNLPVILAVAGKQVNKKYSNVNVLKLGYVQNIEDLYRAADFTILASKYEAFGLVGVESILCGTPLLFSENIACLEAINPSAVISFSRQDESSIIKAIKKALVLTQAGQARLEDPKTLLKYDPTIQNHVEILLSSYLNAINNPIN